LSAGLSRVRVNEVGMKNENRRVGIAVLLVLLAASAPLVLSANAALGSAWSDAGPSNAVRFDGQAPIHLPVPVAGDDSDPHVQMAKLFGKAERRLKEVDQILEQASAGDTRALAKASPAGLDGLLQSSQSRSREVVESIDKILELANHEHPPGSGT
jgi:hypothetical protein